MVRIKATRQKTKNPIKMIGLIGYLAIARRGGHRDLRWSTRRGGVPVIVNRPADLFQAVQFPGTPRSLSRRSRSRREQNDDEKNDADDNSEFDPRNRPSLPQNAELMALLSEQNRTPQRAQRARREINKSKLSKY
jgi:hypothetical protein